MTKIAIVGPIHDDGLSVLKKQNLEILEIDDFSSKNLIEKLKDVDGIAIRTANLSEEILENCKNLKICLISFPGYLKGSFFCGGTIFATLLHEMGFPLC